MGCLKDYLLGMSDMAGRVRRSSEVSLPYFQRSVEGQTMSENGHPKDGYLQRSLNGHMESGCLQAPTSLSLCIS